MKTEPLPLSFGLTKISLSYLFNFLTLQFLFVWRVKLIVIPLPNFIQLPVTSIFFMASAYVVLAQKREPKNKISFFPILFTSEKRTA